MNKEQILKHIQAARVWLDKAQDFVENNNIIRGLSFLFLASAETQMPLRESKISAKKEQPEKSVFRFKPVYSAALAASITFIISFAGWKMAMKSNQTVTAQRVSASEFVARMKEVNEKESHKASSMLKVSLNALKQQLEESKPAKNSRWIAFHSPKKITHARKLSAKAPAVEEIIKTEADEAVVEKTKDKLSAAVTEGKNISQASAEEDLFALVKIAEKTLKGQN